MPKARVNLTIDPDLWERTKRLAQERHTSASALVASALEEALRRPNLEARLQAVRRMAARNLPIGTPEEIEAEIELGRSMSMASCMPDLDDVLGPEHREPTTAQR